ncbi:MAG TPA: hypothetical protein VFF69_04585 [Phycisphaerales bacterium]|nr:hypothetical protein [Phycisphaerales bacterium]
MWQEWSDWAHVVWSTLGHWIPGDPRGFRDHDHRIHSTGDYKNPPPPGEHARLHRYARARCPDEVEIPEALRPKIAEVLARKLLALGKPPRIIAVARVHVHALVRAGPIDVRPFIGRAKQAASHAVRHDLPGRVWGQRCHPVRIRDADHFRDVVDYIAAHLDEGAAIWIHPDVRRASRPASTDGRDSMDA